MGNKRSINRLMVGADEMTGGVETSISEDAGEACINFNFASSPEAWWHLSLTPSQARRIGGTLIQLADEVDQTPGAKS